MHILVVKDFFCVTILIYLIDNSDIHNSSKQTTPKIGLEQKLQTKRSSTKSHEYHGGTLKPEHISDEYIDNLVN